MPRITRKRPWSVLVVDDEHELRAMVRGLLLATDPTLHVDEAACGIAALAALDAAPYDVVVMDLQMPGMDGVETTRELRARGHYVPVVAFTACPDPTVERRFVEAGAQRIVGKTRVDELVASVAGLTREPALA